MGAIVALILGATLAGCGNNAFKSLEKKEDDGTQLALAALQANDPDKAIALMLKIIPTAAQNIVTAKNARDTDFATSLAAATQDIPARRETLSVLSSSYAQRGGIKPLSIIIELQKIQENEKSSALALDVNSELEAIAQFFPLFPTLASIDLTPDDQERALQILKAIGKDEQASDKLSKAIMTMSIFITDAKKYDTDRDKLISAEEAALISVTEAQFIYKMMGESRAAIADFQQVSDVQQLNKMKAKVDSFIAEVNTLAGANASDAQLAEAIRQFIVKSSNRVK